MAKPGRRIVDALDDLIAELRLANRLRALELGPAALEHDDGKRATTDTAKRRVAQRNQLRAEVRTALGMGE
ncbi:hypothetical protein [Microbacterium sp. 2FI]|uniref:hypothetical protein n=1 Tax=Microbacterium sp. 2FI TaxID=2502193 RepID=UPI0010F7DE49|nr:hypothetical protein [Microbacterium sp. 2FI]